MKVKVFIQISLVGVAGAAAHELAHLAAALALGIDVVSVSLFDPAYLAPVIAISSETEPWLRTAFGYAGGFGAGTALLLPLGVRRGWFMRSLARWALGLSLAGLGFMQLGLGVMEGALHQLYIESAGRPLGPNMLAAVWAAMAGFMLYLKVFPRKFVL